MGALPPFAAWRHVDQLDGFEVVYFTPGERGLRVAGHSVDVEQGEPYATSYSLWLDAGWRTRFARVRVQSLRGSFEIALVGDGSGSWLLDGVPVPEVEGCLDVDLEASSLTNAFPVRRLALAPIAAADAPAVYVRALDLAVERLEQRYVRIDEGSDDGQRYDYLSVAADFRCEIAYDGAGLVLDYPGIAVRAA